MPRGFLDPRARDPQDLRGKIWGCLRASGLRSSGSNDLRPHIALRLRARV